MTQESINTWILQQLLSVAICLLPTRSVADPQHERAGPSDPLVGPEEAKKGEAEFVVPYRIWHRQGRVLTPSFVKEMRGLMVELSEEDLGALRRALWMYRMAHDQLGYIPSGRNTSEWEHADACAENLFSLEEKLGVCVISYHHFAQHFVAYDKNLAPPLPDWTVEKWPMAKGPVELQVTEGPRELRVTEGPREKSLMEMWTSFMEENKKYRLDRMDRCFKTRYGSTKQLIQNCFVKHA